MKDVLDVMNQDASIPVKRLRVDGGSVVNKFLMQFQSDILGIPIDIPEIAETTALGAAYLAALGVGDFKSSDELTGKWKLARSYEPSMGEDQRQELLYKWHKAVERAKSWAEE